MYIDDILGLLFRLNSHVGVRGSPYNCHSSVDSDHRGSRGLN